MSIQNQTESLEDLDFLSSLQDLSIDDLAIEEELIVEEEDDLDDELLAALEEVDIVADELAALDELVDLSPESKGPLEESELLAAIEEVKADEELTELYDKQAEESKPMPDAPIEVDLTEKVENEIKTKPVRIKAVGATPSAKIASGLSASDLIDLTLLTPDCGAISDDERIEAFGVIVDNLAKKVGEKAVNLFAFLRTGGGLNEVTARAIKVMKRDGQLIGGDDGNLVKELLTKPYSLKTARSQGNQILQLFTALKVGNRTARGTLVLNEESIIWERIKTLTEK